MVNLSVNINKIATLRNSRGGNIPDLLYLSRIILDAGAAGLTVHPRSDERHITRNDVFDVKRFIDNYNEETKKKIEYNIEGEPSERFLDIVLKAKPTQATLVPVSPGEITSDHGFHLEKDLPMLQRIIPVLKKEGIRVAIFMETNIENLQLLQETKADRVELYTGPFAKSFSYGYFERSFEEYHHAAIIILDKGLGLNAGHDLDTENLRIFKHLHGLQEVSIGHRLMSRSLEIGLSATVKEYLEVLGA
ncbi:MAG: pyridoxine 5'-phosphate synthase [Leptospiraceae bacterium]|nr:pyridoxine 5'-phosphate synthase [Leptospiraceae bacterium]